ncbi:NADH:flavin oxidoreductase/NADH oxidase [Alcaligenaceae bacterium]|nr:NADH:flavin oxidoreductase/NADH oxidase [Alcaligenaceae bacterium]
MTQHTSLFEPLSLRGLSLPNRIGLSPMCMYACEPDGLATPWHLVHLGARAIGGAGLIVTEATAVSPQARISNADLGLWSQAHADALRPITAFIEAQGSVPGIQIAHAGRKGGTPRPWLGRKPLPRADGGWDVLAPSPLRFSDHSAAPLEMSERDIAQTSTDFVRAATLAYDAGFRYLELHFGHGYLAHQFLSPLTNLRQDDSGGSFENRTRFVRDITAGVRAAWPDDLPLAVRLSMTDWREDGWDLDDAVRLAADLRSLGVDLVICSSGAIVPGSHPPEGAGMQIPFARRVRAGAGIAAGAVGQITQAEQAQDLIASGGADLVFLGRAMLRDPYWAIHAAEELGQPARWPTPYARAVGRRLVDAS